MTSCSQCNQQNPDDANFCNQCGAALTAATVAAEAVTNVSLPPSMHNDEALWRQFIGPNADQYLATFKKFSSDGQPKFALSWNWPAFLLLGNTFLWFLYRKMYLHAFVYAVGPVVSVFLTGDLTVAVVWSVMAGGTANYLYYWHCKEHIARIKKAGRMDQAAQESALKEAGGVQPYVIWVGVVLYLISMAALLRMSQEGRPDLDKLPSRPAKQAAMHSA